MTQSLSQVFGQHMRMEQRLTPQLIQSMDILQLSTQALENRLAEELEKNVTLEVVEREARPAEPVGENGDEARPGADSESFSRLDRYSRDYDLGFDDGMSSRLGGRRNYDGERDAKLDAMANTASRPQGLDEYLMDQWRMLDLDPDTRRAGEAVIYHLEDDGYLRTPLESIVADMRLPLSIDVVERALARVQRLDPVGIAARDYKECLLLQLEAMPGDNTIERTLVMHHLEDVARNRFPAIAKATGFSLGEIAAAVDVIRKSLVLQPAGQVVEKNAQRIFPDVVVEEDESGKGLVVRLTRGNVPELRIKPEYVEMLKARKNGKEVRDFVRKQIDDGNALIEAIRFRRSRLMDVAKAVVEHQREFFTIGPPGLKVLRMSDLAQELSCDPSTISRTVSEKYVQTPHGVFPLRYFFTGGTDTGDGEAAGWDSIKQKVVEIVQKENPSEPLNDDQIAAELAKENMNISRRTVAKYRAQLDIPPARQRRKFD